jgi:hypothetical protein
LIPIITTYHHIPCTTARNEPSKSKPASRRTGMYENAKATTPQSKTPSPHNNESSHSTTRLAFTYPHPEERDRSESHQSTTTTRYHRKGIERRVRVGVELTSQTDGRHFFDRLRGKTMNRVSRRYYRTWKLDPVRGQGLITEGI